MHFPAHPINAAGDLIPKVSRAAGSGEVKIRDELKISNGAVYGDLNPLVSLANLVVMLAELSPGVTDQLVIFQPEMSMSFAWPVMFLTGSAVTMDDCA